MTVRQVAEYLGVTRFRVHAMIRQGQLTPEMRETDIGTDYYVFKRTDVELLGEERRKRATGEAPPRGGRRPKPPPEKKSDA